MSDLREKLGLLNPEQMKEKILNDKIEELQMLLVDTYNKCGHNLCVDHRSKIFTAIKEAGYEHLIIK
jgi:hypothetical protein